MDQSTDSTTSKTMTDWTRLRTQTDAEIVRAVASDPDAAPIFTAEELKSFRLVAALRPR